MHPYAQLLIIEKKLPNVLTEKSLILQVKLMLDQLRLRRAWVRPA